MEPGSEFKSLIEIVANSTEAFTAALFLPLQSEQVLRLVAYCSLSRRIVEDCTIPFGHGLIGWVAEHGKQMLVSPFRHDSRTLLFYERDESIKSFLGVPVHLPGDEVGVLAIDSKRGYVFPPKVQKILAGFAELFAQMAHRSVEVSRSISGLANLEELREFSRKLTATDQLERVQNFVANVPQSLVPHTGLCLALALDDPERLEIVRAPGPLVQKLAGTEVNLNQSLMGWVYRRGRALYLSDLTEKRKRPCLAHPREGSLPLHSFLGIPLKVADRVLGVMGFTSDRPGEFPRHTTEVLAILSDLIGLAIANAEARLSDSVPRMSWCAGYGDFHADLEERLAEPGRTAPLSLFLVDPCNLSRLNGRYGFRATDSFLAAAARLLARCLPSGERVLPTEGGGMLVMRDPMGVDDAAGFAERVTRTFSERLLAVDELDVAFPVRVASATWPVDGKDRDELLSKLLGRRLALKTAGHGNRAENFDRPGRVQ